jgi:hypothetical protein
MSYIVFLILHSMSLVLYTLHVLGPIYSACPCSYILYMSLVIFTLHVLGPTWYTYRIKGLLIRLQFLSQNKTFSPKTFLTGCPSCPSQVRLVGP